jgi:hypothetical protein
MFGYTMTITYMNLATENLQNHFFGNFEFFISHFGDISPGKKRLVPASSSPCLCCSSCCCSCSERAQLRWRLWRGGGGAMLAPPVVLVTDPENQLHLCLSQLSLQ